MAQPPIQLTPDQVRRALARRVAKRRDGVERPAAVLVPLLQRDGMTCVLLTKRTETVRSHPGQFSFPGGMSDAGDGSLVATAVREAEEEVGISRSDVDVLGTMDDLMTGLGVWVTPVVGWIPHPYTYRPSPREVALVVELPWASFVRPPRARTLLGEGFRRLVVGFEIEGHFIWGTTGRILRALVALLEPPQ